jgi:iron complex transport system substrate-binding protein
MRQHKRSRVSAVVLGAALFITAACGSDASDAESEIETSATETDAPANNGPTEETPVEDESTAVSVTDATGEVIELDKPAMRVACVHELCTDMMSSLGVLPIADYRDPAQIGVAAYYGDAVDEVALIADRDSVEEVAALEPDLFVLRDGQEDRKAALETIAPVLVVDITSTAGLTEGMLNLGELTGQSDAADVFLSSFESDMAELTAGVPDGAAETRVGIGFSDPGDYYWMMWESNAMCQLIAEIEAGTCVFPDQPVSEYGSPDGEFAAEFVLEADPEVFVSMTWEGATPVEDRAGPVWSELTSTQDGRFYDDASNGAFGNGLTALWYAAELYAFNAFPDAGFEDPGPWPNWTP